MKGIWFRCIWPRCRPHFLWGYCRSLCQQTQLQLSWICAVRPYSTLISPKGDLIRLLNGFSTTSSRSLNGQNSDTQPTSPASNWNWEWVEQISAPFGKMRVELGFKSASVTHPGCKMKTVGYTRNAAQKLRHWRSLGHCFTGLKKFDDFDMWATHIGFLCKVQCSSTSWAFFFSINTFIQHHLHQLKVTTHDSHMDGIKALARPAASTTCSVQTLESIGPDKGL